MSDDDLVSKLRSALLHHQVSLKSVPRIVKIEEDHDGPNDPTISYLSSMLLDDDEQQQQPETLDDFQRLVGELNSLVSESSSPGSASSPSSSSSASTGSQQQQDSEMQQTPTQSEIEEAETDLLKAHLIDCAKAVASNQGSEVHRLAREIRTFVAPMHGSPKARTTLTLVDALVARYSGFGAQVHKAMVKGLAEGHSAYLRLVSLPYFRVPQIFANVTIYEACRNAERIHIVDYGIFQGCQWPVFITRMARRPEGPPRIRLTGVDFPSVDLELTGRSLVEFARSHGVVLEFHSISSNSWETAQPRCFLDEVLVVNCTLRLRHLREDGSVVDNPRKRFFEMIHRMKPAIFLTGVLHADSNMSSPFFVQRFEAALHPLFTRVEFFEALLMPQQSEEFSCMLNISFKNFMNIVACEGLERIERPSSYKSWDGRARKAGFEQAPLCTHAVEKVTNIWRSHHGYNENFKIGTDENWLLLGFKDLIIFGLCAWRPRNYVRSLS